MISVREVKTGNSESSVNELFELRNLPACRAQSADNLALAFFGLRLGHYLLERNVGAAEFRAGSSHSGAGEHVGFDEEGVKSKGS
jgi:hypothetical protein